MIGGYFELSSALIKNSTMFITVRPHAVELLEWEFVIGIARDECKSTRQRRLDFSEHNT
jgi:hypothetical protein